ncbi:MAG: HXXEE domain-containing protein [Prevotella sp.]|jgi:FtsH-binding integral membrane protein|nr:HXXEE domain-containing protein [Prevotella sp.]
MDKFNIIVWVLPIVFMVHDFEEIIFFKPCIQKNGMYIKERFPFLTKLFDRLEHLSVPAFSIAVFEEFVLLSLVTFVSVMLGYYNVWLALFMAFFIHIIIHIIQWVILSRYIPAIVTSILVLPYCIFGFISIITIFSLPEILIWTAIGLLIMILNLYFAHFLASKFNKKFYQL